MPRPATGKTPVRNLRVAEEIWRDAQEQARAEGRTLTDVITAYLRRYGAPARRLRERGAGMDVMIPADPPGDDS